MPKSNKQNQHLRKIRLNIILYFIILYIFTYIWQEEMSMYPEKAYKYI